MPGSPLLILGGTFEAVKFALAAQQRFGDRISLTTSLAGRLELNAKKLKKQIPGRVRVGGFGGAAGLEAYMREEGTVLAVDATHPFAAQISANLREACEALALPRLTFSRPMWQKHPDDRWIEVADTAEAARVVSDLGRVALITSGIRSLMPFASVEGVHFVVRQITSEGEAPPFADYELILGRGPFTLHEEKALMERHKIDVLVTKASGGLSTEAKIIAARELGLPVVMIKRPRPEPGDRVETVEEALKWVADKLSSFGPP